MMSLHPFIPEKKETTKDFEGHVNRLNSVLQRLPSAKGGTICINNSYNEKLNIIITVMN